MTNRLRSIHLILLAFLSLTLSVSVLVDGKLARGASRRDSNRQQTGSVRKENPRLIFVTEGSERCDVKLWDPLQRTVTTLTSPPTCPERLFVANKGNAVLVTTKTTLQEIKMYPEITAKPGLELPKPQINRGNYPAEPCFAGYLSDGSLIVVLESHYPYDDTDLFVYAFKEN